MRPNLALVNRIKAHEGAERDQSHSLQTSLPSCEDHKVMFPGCLLVDGLRMKFVCGQMIWAKASLTGNAEAEWEQFENRH